MYLTILYSVLIAAMLVGVVGAVVPGIPGPSLILGAILIWVLVQGFGSIGWPLVAIFVILILSAGVEFLATYLGAKRAGASKWGQAGAVLGLVLGFFWFAACSAFWWSFVGYSNWGPILGAFIGEFLYRRKLELDSRIKVAFKAGVGIVVGSLIGNLIEALLALASVVIFVVSTWPPGAGI